MSSPVVSVVIPTYKRAQQVVRAVESVCRQTFEDIEVVVVNDGSPDNTIELVGAITDPRVRCITHPVNRGRCAARNTGIQESRGRYVALLDDDDEWAPSKLAKQMQVMRTSPLNPGVVICGIGYVGEDEHDPPPKMLRGQVFDAILHRRLKVSVCSILTDKERAGEVLFDSRAGEAGEEFGFTLELASRAPFDYVPERLVHVHRNHGRKPHDGINGRLRVLENFREVLEAHPRALARHRFELAVAYLGVDDEAAARTFLWQSIRANPMDYRPWAALTLLSLGVHDMNAFRTKLARLR